jgi:hypothetical protein
MKPAISLSLSTVCVTLALTSITVVTARAQSKTEAPPTKYWILFSDKDAGLGKGPAPVEPGFVTERALERRKLRGRPVPGNLDAPVSPAYVESLKSAAIQPIVESRWMNGVSAYLTPDKLERVKNLAFVHDVKTVATSVENTAPATPVVVAGAYATQDLNFGASATQLNAINAVAPIEEGFIGTGIRLGFLDTTTDTLHPALKHLADDGRIIAVRDIPGEFGLGQSNSHGLNTSSVAVGFDEGNLIGACYGAEYLFASTEYAPSETNQEEDFFVAGMEWMERMGADIVNVSLGYSEFDDGEQSYTYEDLDGDTAVTTRAADRAAALGVVVVTSAGNEGTHSWFYITSPADGDSVIAVGASDFNLNPQSFSGNGPTPDGRIKPDVAAPGAGITYASSVASSGYSSGGGGTSFSSPFVASVACQVLQANPTLNPVDVRSVLRSTAHQPASPDNRLGWGVINAQAALELAKVAVTETESQELPGDSPGVALYPNPAVDQAIVSFELSDDAVAVTVSLHDVLGRVVSKALPERVGSAITATLDLRELPAGTYFVRVASDQINETRSLVVTR